MLTKLNNAQRYAAAAGLGVGGAALGIFLGRALKPQQPAPASTSDDDRHHRTPSTAEIARQKFCRYGLPSDEHIVVMAGYASSLSYRLRIPNWVAELYTDADVDGEGVDRKHSKFGADPSVPGMFRADNADYRGSKLSRGHLAPAGAHKQSQATLNETFNLSANILPQELSNNGSDWLRLERFARKLTDTYSAVHRQRVEYDVIGPHAVAVPTHLFKVILAEDAKGTRRALSAFILPNGPLPGHPDLDEFVVPLREVERASGLTLFQDLGDERYAIRPLCGPTNGGGGNGGADGGQQQPRCGVGAMDGRIIGWKLFGSLKLANDCKQLAAAWADVQSAGKLDNMNLMRAVREEKSCNLACPLQEGTASTPRSSPAAAAAVRVTAVSSAGGGAGAAAA